MSSSALSLAIIVNKALYSARDLDQEPGVF